MYVVLDKEKPDVGSIQERLNLAEVSPTSSKRSPHFETRSCLEGSKVLVMDLEETEARNYCAGEGRGFTSKLIYPAGKDPTVPFVYEAG
jgi:hypothetical protein